LSKDEEKLGKDIKASSLKGFLTDSFQVLEAVLHSPLYRYILPGVVFVSVVVANYFVFLGVPNERIMGAVQRIFYFHVGSAFAVYASLGLLFFGSVCFLITRMSIFDCLARAAGELSFLLASVVLATGIIWGHSAWNVWWRWEPRLVSMLILWMLVLAYSVLRVSVRQESFEHRRGAAVLGILSAVQVPVVVFSVKLMPQVAQLHPQAVGSQGLEDSNYILALLVTIFAMLALSSWLVMLRASDLLAREVILVNSR